MSHPPSRMRKRGMHLNGWAINYPFTFRSWREEDWYRYLDLLHEVGINLFLFWPFMEIIPLPLSADDTAYLTECRRVVAYAQQHGMEVWIMQSPNRVAQHDCGVTNPRQRPYWDFDVQVDQNPADPQQLHAILAARAVLYQHIDNADGYLTIDCDPGGWPDGSIDDFIRIFEESRKLLDRYTLRGTAAKQICWLWFGWHWRFDPYNPFTNLDTIRAEIQGLQARLPEPWELVAGLESHLPLCRELGVLEKTVFLPYGLLEDEPSLPFTCLRFAQIADTFRVIDTYPELAGVMANVQCPVLQLPNSYQYWQYLFAPPAARSEQATLLHELASRIFPDHAALLADSFAAITSTNAGHIDQLASALEQARDEDAFQQVGNIGLSLFPTPTQLIDDLIFQLRFRAAEERLIRLCSENDNATALTAGLVAYFDCVLAWDARHGYRLRFQGETGDSYFGQGLIPNSPRFQTLLSALRTTLGHHSEQLRTLFTTVSDHLPQYDRELLWKGCMNPMIKLLTQTKEEVANHG